MLEHDGAIGLDTPSELRASRGKRKTRLHDEACDSEFIDIRQNKRIELALTKPSYVLGNGAKKLRSEHRRRLEFLLRGLVRQQNWTEACGVLSVYLKGTCKDRSPENNRFKYSVLMELLDCIDNDQLNSTRIKHIYVIWMRRLGSRKNCSLQDRLAVHLEFILFCLGQGNIDEAHQTSQSIKQAHDFEKDPLANVVLGLVLYQLWYSSIPKELQRVEREQLITPPPSETVNKRFGSLAGNTEEHNALYTREDDSHYRSNSSVMMEKRLSNYNQSVGPREVEVKVEHSEECQPQHHIQSQGFYVNSTENEVSLSNDAAQMHYASNLFNLRGLDPWLLPIQLPQTLENFEDLNTLQRQILNDYYDDALKYLQQAGDLSPLASDALLPLIQLLLIGGQVDKALKVLEDLSYNSDAVFPIRLRVVLLEHFDRTNYDILSSCYERILKIDPTCSHSISKLISMHHNGDYNTESLTEMIALHLDYAHRNTWLEFAVCFLKLTQHEEDRISICLNGEEEDGFKRRRSVCYKNVPKIFLSTNAAPVWKYRCRCWLAHHFSRSMLKSEIPTGDLQLLSYKAACASHLFGPEFEYVVEVHNILDDRDMLSFLQLHMQSSVGLYKSFQDKSHGR